jgi:alkylation response protein AidB-like acyl-CoA dehydrogenase
MQESTKGTAMTRPTDESVEEFSARARAWLEDNFDRRPPARAGGANLRGVDLKTVENVKPEREKQRRLYEAGFAGITYPKEYGGQGLTVEHERAFNRVASEFAMPDMGVAGGTTFSVCAKTMLAHASPEFLRRHIPAILAGEELWVQFFSEPEAGSDLAGIRTRATRDGDRWILEGAKIWTSGAYYADYGMCLARTNWDVPKHKGLTWFGVPIRAKGVTVEPIREINGDAEFCQEFFDGVELSDDDIIGEVDHGWRVAQAMLVFERGGGDNSSYVPKVAGDDLAPDLVAIARRTGRDKDPRVRQLIAQAHINDFAQVQLAEHITRMALSARGNEAAIAAYGKLAAGMYGAIRGQLGMQIAGADGLLWAGDDLEGRTAAIGYLNARQFAIAGGTNEVQRNGIGERVLGLPREPSFDSTKPFNEVLRNARNWSGQVG